MKREEKNLQTQRRILDSALTEFAEQGYGASSVNSICSAQGLSKGILYHYFDTKDDLYLACVEECFHALTHCLQAKTALQEGGAPRQLEAYFRERLVFFQEHPRYQKIFCGALMTPPAHLATAISERKAPFDAFNAGILRRILEPLDLCPGVSLDEVIQLFRQYQDFINARCSMNGAEQMDICQHEKSCQQALNFLLYGVIARKESF